MGNHLRQRGFNGIRRQLRHAERGNAQHAAAGFHQRQNHRFVNAGHRQQAVFDLVNFNTVAIQFDLAVVAALTVDEPRFITQIAGPVAAKRLVFPMK